MSSIHRNVTKLTRDVDSFGRLCRKVLLRSLCLKPARKAWGSGMEGSGEKICEWGGNMNQVTPYADRGQNDLEGRLDRNQVSCDGTRAARDSERDCCGDSS